MHSHPYITLQSHDTPKKYGVSLYNSQTLLYETQPHPWWAWKVELVVFAMQCDHPLHLHYDAVRPSTIQPQYNALQCSETIHHHGKLFDHFPSIRIQERGCENFGRFFGNFLLVNPDGWGEVARIFYHILSIQRRGGLWSLLTNPDPRERLQEFWPFLLIISWLFRKLERLQNFWLQ